MKPRRFLSLVLAVGIVTGVGLALPTEIGLAEAPPPETITLEVLEGTVTVTRSGETIPIPVTGIVEVGLLDRVQTGADGLARLIMLENTVVVLNENTDFTLRAFYLNVEGGHTIIFSFDQGFFVSHVDLPLPNSEFRVRAPNSEVIVHGTDFGMLSGEPDILLMYFEDVVVALPDEDILIEEDLEMGMSLPVGSTIITGPSGGSAELELVTGSTIITLPSESAFVLNGQIDYSQSGPDGAIQTTQLGAGQMASTAADTFAPGPIPAGMMAPIQESMAFAQVENSSPPTQQNGEATDETQPICSPNRRVPGGAVGCGNLSVGVCGSDGMAWQCVDVESIGCLEGQGFCRPGSLGGPSSVPTPPPWH